MKIKHLPRHPRIASSDLARLTLDNASARKFAGRYLRAVIGGILLGCGSLLVGYLLYRAGALSAWATGAVMAAGMLPGLSISYFAHQRMLRAIPLSVQSGRQMLPFVVQDREQDDYIEIAYIDQSSGTYFTKSYVA